MRDQEQEISHYDSFDEFLYDDKLHKELSGSHYLNVLKLREKLQKEMDVNQSMNPDKNPDLFEKLIPKRLEYYRMIEKSVINSIKIRRRHISYLINVYTKLKDVEYLVDLKTSNANNIELPIYQKAWYYYQWGLANDDLGDFASINTSLKYMRKLMKKVTSAVVSKELLENLTREQKKDLKSYTKMKYSKLLDNHTIVNPLLPQLKTIASNCQMIFFEDELFNIHAHLIYKDKARTAMCGKGLLKTKTSIVLRFEIKQEEVLELMKEDPNVNRVFGEALEFNVGKLNKIINLLYKSRNAYVLMDNKDKKTVN